MYNIFKKLNANLLGIHSNDPRYRQELIEVAKYYEFYDAKPDNQEEIDQDCEYGQLWKYREDDYRPTREVRNLTKKLIDKQARFMLAIPPNLMFKAKSLDDVDNAEMKRTVIEQILDAGKFWSKSYNAFKDCTIGKRVLLAVLANRPSEGSEGNIRFRYYTMPEFTYQFDPNDCEVLTKVQIAYQDERTVGAIDTQQRWHKWTYEMREEKCWAIYQVVDGLNQQVFTEIALEPNEAGVSETERYDFKEEWDTGLTQIPCKVILNDGLTGDTKGRSDIKDLMDLAMNYNKTNSDYRDALRFKMFEQPVFTDADPNSIKGIRIAPNAIIDLKTDPSASMGEGGSKQASASMLSSTFNFVEGAECYLDRLKREMYEIMEQPLPEQLKEVPSGKALKMLYYDLIARCEDKWIMWDSAIMWMIDLIIEMINTLGLYADVEGIEAINTVTVNSIKHNVPIADDAEEAKKVAIEEVKANVKSHKTYIREFGQVEDEDAEWNEIMEETDSVNMSSNVGMMGLDDEEGNTSDSDGEDEQDALNGK